MKRTTQEGVMCVFDDKDNMIAIIRNDIEKTREVLLYSCSKMGVEEVAELLNADLIKSETN